MAKAFIPATENTAGTSFTNVVGSDTQRDSGDGHGNDVVGTGGEGGNTGGGTPPPPREEPTKPPATPQIVKLGNVFTFVRQGVTCTTTPYYQPFKAGLCTMTSKQLLTFDRPVSRATVQLSGIGVGQLVALDVNSNVLSSISLDTGDLNGDDFELVSQAGIRAISFDLFKLPITLVDASFDVISGPTEPPAEPPVIPPPPPAPPTTTTGTTPKDINLMDLIRLTKSGINREYVKNSMKAIDSDSFFISNISSDIEIDVVLRGASGVSFDPNIITLGPRAQALINVNFDVPQVNNLDEGVTRVTCTLDLSSRSVVSNPAPPPVVPPTPPPPPPPPIEPPIVIVEPHAPPPVVPVPPPIVEPPPPDPISLPPVPPPAEPDPTTQTGGSGHSSDDEKKTPDDGNSGGIFSVLRKKFFDF